MTSIYVIMVCEEERKEMVAGRKGKKKERKKEV